MVSSPRFHVALVIFTMSAAGGVPGLTVIVAVRVIANQRAVMVTAVAGATAEVARLNVPVEAFALTTVSCGTRATAGLLLDSCTTAPCVIGAVNRTVPVAFWPPTTEVGTNEMDERDGPAGVAAFTERGWLRDELSGVAPVICTFSDGADAGEVMVNVPMV